LNLDLDIVGDFRNEDWERLCLIDCHEACNLRGCFRWLKDADPVRP
jgi:hypothetical protein